MKSSNYPVVGMTHSGYIIDRIGAKFWLITGQFVTRNAISSTRHRRITRIIKTVRLVLLPLGWSRVWAVELLLGTSLSWGEGSIAGGSLWAVGFRLVPQNPQNLASVRTGRRQLGQIVGMLITPFCLCAFS